MICAAVIVGVDARAAQADYPITLCGPSLITNGATGYEPYPFVTYDCTNDPPVISMTGMSSYSKEELTDLGMLQAGHKYGISFNAPGHITITGVTAVLTSEARRSGSPVELQASDTDGLFFNHMILLGEGLTYPIDESLPGVQSITLGEQCTTILNSSCFFQSPYGLLTIEKLTLLLHDNETPSLSLTGGRLLLPGTQAGTEDVTFSAAAQESGIAEVDAYLGSTLVGSNAYQSTQCSYTTFEPCPKSLTDDIKIDTTKVPDGTYPLILEARDASGNTVSVASSDPISLANHASPAGAPPSTGPPASSTTAAMPGAPNGQAATTKAQITYLSGQDGKITAGDGQAVSVSGRLTNQTGTPISGATLDLLYQTAGSNEPFAVGGHATTNADGVYTFTLPAGPSRLIRSGYRAFANDSGYDTTSDLAETVTATTTLKVTPTHLRGRTFTFYGQVHAGYFPPRQQVEIQALIGPNTWTHVTFARVTANGRFKVRYRLKHHYNHVTFTFQATPVASPIWPYETQPSNHARLHLV